MDNTAQIMWGVLFSGIGVSYFIYGRKQRSVVPLCCGIGLSVFPFVVTNTYLMVAVGSILVALPYFLRGRFNR
ncbi:MAG: hypothetical protein Q9M09_04975 [Mariprofundaceae bacterium]|nr:hypothetical protein [Mariprofundaceae bacterium]